MRFQPCLRAFSFPAGLAWLASFAWFTWLVSLAWLASFAGLAAFDPVALGAEESAALGKRFVADGGILGSPAVSDDGSVYVVTDARSLLRLDVASGLRWNVPVGGKPLFLVKKKDGVLLVPTADLRIFAFNPEGGRGPAFPAGEEAPLALLETQDGRLVVAEPSGRVSLRTPAGRRLLSWYPGARFTAPPRLGPGDNVACALEDGRLEVRKLSGAVVWKAETGFEVSGLLWTGEGKLVAAAKDGSLALFSSEGREEARRVLSSAPTGLYALPLGGFAASSADGEVLFFDAGGDIRRSYKTEGGSLGGAADGTGLLYVAGKRSGLTAFTEKDGLVFSSPAYKLPSPPAVSPGGRFLAAAGADWVLYLFEILRYRTSGHDPATAEAPARQTERPRDFEKDLDFILFSSLAASPSFERKEAVIAEFEARLGREAFGKAVDYASVLLREIVDSEVLSGRRWTKTLPLDLRLRAIRLLGLLGSGEDRFYLIDCLKKETDEVALAETVDALGELRSDPDGRVRQALGFLASRESLSSQLAEAAVGALEKIRAYQGGPAGPEEGQLLQRIVSGRYGRGLLGRVIELYRK